MNRIKKQNEWHWFQILFILSILSIPVHFFLSIEFLLETLSTMRLVVRVYDRADMLARERSDDSIRVQAVDDLK